jgi:hypothetical protein
MTGYVWDGQYFGKNGVQGGTIPATIWHKYMAAAIASEPQYAGNFTPVYYLNGMTLPPPGSGSVLYPQGLGTTTTSTTPSSSTTLGTSQTTRPTATTRPVTPPSSVPSSTTTRPQSTTTTTQASTATTRKVP